MDTHNLIVDFGKHSGERWTRVPVSYLKWMANEPSFADDKRAIANAELKRRGTVTPEIEVSGHAIDRASLQCRKIWHETALDENEGLHAWLCRMATEARNHGETLESGKVKYQGMKFVFAEGELYPVLKTVTR